MHCPKRIRQEYFLIGMFFALLAILTIIPSFSAKPVQPSRVAVVLDIKGPIGPATSDYIHRGFEKARQDRAAMIILKIDTPGGLDISMRTIIKDILDSPIPVASYVSPSGARAASAGTFILYASHIAAMAPATTLGAATPVQIGGGGPLPGPKEEDGKKSKKPKPTMADKAVSDAVAFIEGLAELHGRNKRWAKKAVLEAASLPANQALKQNVIDFIAKDLSEVLQKSHGRRVKVLNQYQQVTSKDLGIKPIEPDWRTKLLAVITNPYIAYILLLIGFYGLIFEFTHPGTVVPGVVGAICLMLALFAFHVLPVNYAGLGLIILGIAFMVAEAFIPSFGILGIGGLIAFIVGAIMLLDTDIPGFGVSWKVIAALGGTTGLIFLSVLTLMVRSQRRPVVSGMSNMIGSTGDIIEWSGTSGRILIMGERWTAESTQTLAAGTKKVRVISLEGLMLKVEPIKKKEKKK